MKSISLNKYRLEETHVFWFIAILWLAFGLEQVLDLNFQLFGILPRSAEGLVGIITACLIHNDLFHLMGNTIPLFAFGYIIVKLEPKNSVVLLMTSYLGVNILVWFFARDTTVHLGASGIVYAVFVYIVAAAVFLQDFIRIVAALAIIVFYSTSIEGLFIPDADSSWESHTFGAIIGALNALYLVGYKHIGK